jgi:hypothetical protein
MTPERLEQFSLKEMRASMRESAPMLYEMIGVLADVKKSVRRVDKIPIALLDSESGSLPPTPESEPPLEFDDIDPDFYFLLDWDEDEDMADTGQIDTNASGGDSDSQEASDLT